MCVCVCLYIGGYYLAITSISTAMSASKIEAATFQWEGRAAYLLRSSCLGFRV